MDRRSFIQGAFAVAAAAAIPVGDGVELQCIPHPTTNILVTPEEMGQKMARALARSMMQTREIVARNVLNRAFGDDHG